MSAAVLVLTSLAYVALLFLVAHYAERRSARGRSIVNNPIIYSLSLAVYCTAWTFYGSVGRAASHGIGFLPIYLGPVILAPLWWLVLRKIILISKSQRITSVADFISSRYGKSRMLGMIATLIAALGIIPYISIQLKAITTSFAILTGAPGFAADGPELPFYLDGSLYVACTLALFAILFGTRRLDANERHEGLVAAIAFESLVKLIAFLAVGIFVTYSLFDGFGDIFSQANAQPAINRLFSFTATGIDGWEWLWLILLSMCGILFLPRQFHVAVVENTDPRFVATASWLFPLYLLLINVFVLPIALGGLLHFPAGAVEADTFVLHLPLSEGNNFIALIAGIGGFSAATSMVIVAVIALSIMISNNLVLPLLLRPRLLRTKRNAGLTTRLLAIRRISIICILLLANGYFHLVGEAYSLVSLGLVSFTAIAQFAPALIGGMYWKGGTRRGALGGLITGFLLWIYTLPLPAMVESGHLPTAFISEGPWGIGLLRPYALFGLQSLDPISHTAFWSLLFNIFAYVGISLFTRQSPLEVTQADIFVDIYKYRDGNAGYEVRRRRARLGDIHLVLQRFLGERRTAALLSTYEQTTQTDLSTLRIAGADLVNYAETHLAGAIGAASAKIIIGSITKDDPISLEEMFRILEQTQEVIRYSQALEKKSAELEQTTAQLKVANEQLQELDRLKADFITTVTHELRTPITAIKALSKILLDDPGLPDQQRKEFLSILVSESERITRLINQVLDLEKLRSRPDPQRQERIDLVQLIRQAYAGLRRLMDERGIRQDLHLPDAPIFITGDWDRLTQVMVNLLSNAIKFCPSEGGAVEVRVETSPGKVSVLIRDNGPGIDPKDQQVIFEKFTQIQRAQLGKPQGSGLGLFISRAIVEQHGGRISLISEPGEGAVFEVQLPVVT